MPRHPKAPWCFTLTAFAIAACAPSSSRSADSLASGDPALAPLMAAQRFEEPPAAPASRNGRTVEVSLNAGTSRVALADGRMAEMLTYNGSYPGPTIDVVEGDRLVVHFKNTLSEATSLHWHGLHIPADQDDAAEMVAPGQTREFVFDIPADGSGTYWYHPHMHGAVASQVARGLFGVLRVKAKQDVIPAAVKDTIVALSDARIDASGNATGSREADRANGFEGDQILVNGRVAPTLTLQPGESRRLRLLNASASRYYRLSVPGQALTIVATDGGLIDRPAEASEVLLTPGERTEVIIKAPAGTGASVALTSLPYDRGAMASMDSESSGHSGHVMAMDHDMPGMPSAEPTAGGHDMPDMGDMPEGHEMPMMSPMPSTAPTSASGQSLLTITTDGAPVPAVTLPTTLRTIERLGTGLPVSRTLTFSEDHAQADFRINGQKFDPARVDIRPKLGTTEVWEIKNSGHMDHPFHIHGFDFQVLDRNGVAEPRLGWKDTVNVRANESVRFAIRFADFPGRRVFHCHILDHEDLGMMGQIEVER